MFGNSSAEEDRFHNQCAEFDRFGELVKCWNEQPAIVDDDYPAWRHEFEGRLQSFFEAALANGRFSPRSRFGMKLPSVALLQNAEAKFRAYAQQHMAKIPVLEAGIAALDEGDDVMPLRRKIADTTTKADVNLRTAEAISEYLKS